MKSFTIALAGNPNTGKTSVFNALTGAHQRVGNWPGVTVEQLSGYYHHAQSRINVVDLPGLYTFTSSTEDEQVAMNYLVNERPDLVINIVDASNMERSLYLSAELLEMQIPMLIVVNKIDRTERRNIKIDLEHLAHHLDCPVVAVSAAKMTGLDELRQAIVHALENPHVPDVTIAYDPVLEKFLSRMTTELQEEPLVCFNTRWTALKLVDNEPLPARANALNQYAHAPSFQEEIRIIEKHTGDDISAVVAGGRYGFTHGLARDVISRARDTRESVSDSIDRFMLSQWVGIPAFFLVMYVVFFITITIGTPFINFFNAISGFVFVDGVTELLHQLNASELLTVLLGEGVGRGIQTLTSFIPPVFFIFLCLSFLEDSGYLSRAAFVMDRFLQWVGLPGKAFLPLMVGFGCNVPAILATRTLESRRDRILTIMMTPFMSCGARLPVYALFATAFFPGKSGTIIFSLYMTGILLAVLTGLLFKNSLLKGSAAAYVMELPPYHVPTLRGIWFHTFNQLKNFIIKAGQIILPAVILLSLLNNVTLTGHLTRNDSRDSALCSVSRVVTPLFRPMGISNENWPATVGLFSGIVAKEAVIGTLDALYAQIKTTDLAANETTPSLSSKMLDAITALPRELFQIIIPPQETASESHDHAARNMVRLFGSRRAAYAYLLFVLLYIPCLATLGAVLKETGPGWTLLLGAYLTCTAWLTSTLFYQLTTIAEHPVSSLGWTGFCIAVIAFCIKLLKHFGNRNTPIGA